MPRYCAIVINARGIARWIKSAGRIKQAAIPCVKRDRRLFTRADYAPAKKQAPRGRLF
jgi:hypothetical protein